MTNEFISWIRKGAVWLGLFCFACHSDQRVNPSTGSHSSDPSFNDFETRFLDAYWKQYTASAINIGYGKYYEDLVIPDSASHAADAHFSSRWLDSLKAIDVSALNESDRISYLMMENQLRSDLWYNDTLKPYQWNPSAFNLTGDCFYILADPNHSIDIKLKSFSAHIRHADQYYQAALLGIKMPMKELVELAIQQNEGGMDVFGKHLADSIKVSNLSLEEKTELVNRAIGCVTAIKKFTASLREILIDKNYTFRDFRLNKALYDQKFKYDLGTNFSADELFKIAINDRIKYQQRMYVLSQQLWSKYCQGLSKPVDSLTLIKQTIDAISLHHASPGHLLDTLTHQVHALQSFILQKGLFNYDTSQPLVVRLMPAFLRGVALANAEFLPPYQKSGITYFNIEDLSQLTPAEVEGTLREYNDYSLQYLTIHEAMPGHCLQGVYNNLKSKDMIKAVFQNGTMVEGWAVYCEGMMYEEGWGNHSPEMELILCKWRLRELSNVIVDYGNQCLNYSKADVLNVLKKGAFQTDAQANEKYHRATVSQVQLCSYYAGYKEIESLRGDLQKRMGNQFRLLDFHEQLLSHGSAPIKFIRQLMVK